MSESQTKKTNDKNCHCPYCDSELAETRYPFCGSCGEKVQFCPHCGKPTERGAETCACCGKPIAPKG